MQEVEKIWFNGKMVPWGEAKTHVLTHTLHYGTGVFEGIRCYNTSNGPAIFKLKDHIKRLFDSARIMQMRPSFEQKDYEEACKKVVKENNLKECYIRPLLFYGYGQMGLSTKNCAVDSIVAAWPWGTYLGEEGLKNGVRAKISSYQRHFVNSMMTKAKTCGNYVNSTLAKMEALNSGYEEAVMLDTNGYVAECTGENIFVVKDNELITPPILNALDGITRKCVMQIASNEGIVVKEKLFTRDYLYTVEECFITGTAAEITPIREIDDRQIGSGKPGEITKKLQQTYFNIVHGKEKNYEDWLDYV